MTEPTHTTANERHAPQNNPVDHADRQRALDPGQSFIVQAPAGSGKTGLLTQRFLRLLITAEHPEEVVAITFTRKAAAEMRGRIIEALHASSQAEPEIGYEKQTWQLARQAMHHAGQQHWRLLDNPQRLRIQTIDSLCGALGRQMPLATGFGDVPKTEEDSSALYAAAAERVMARLETGEQDDNGELADALEILLIAVDNRQDTAQQLIANMLAQRDQWLRHIARGHAREKCEAVLTRVVEDHLAGLRAMFPTEAAAELPALARYAAENLLTKNPASPVTHNRNLQDLPTASTDALDEWNGLADLLLTLSGTWRKSVTVANGFPAGKAAPDPAMKPRMLELLDDLRENEPLQDQLHQFRKLPDPFYPAEEWQTIQAMFTVLINAAAELNVVFGEQGRVDFTEIALAADRALGPDDEPSDLALRLDYRIRHLLVDEFQDTSQNQYGLIQKLTAGWQHNDGRTLFLVGDPMQSIYGWREAEVGLFLDAVQRRRLGDVPLEPLQLKVNFRSDQGIIDWVNETFPKVFPDNNDTETGAVEYAPSQADKPPGDKHPVTIHPEIVEQGGKRDDEAEAEVILEIIQKEQQNHDHTTAILVRSKSHLEDIVERLRARNIRFQAVEIDKLEARAAVMDAMSLTLALGHLADRVHWLALLHGPLVGMTLKDLHALTGDDEEKHHKTLPDLLLDGQATQNLSQDGKQRAERIKQILLHATEEQHRRPLRDAIESAWLALGGPITLRDEAAASDVERYFRMLQQLEQKGEAPTPECIKNEVEKLFSSPDPQADERLQIMTMHKAKGLEFDTVILPGLGKQTRSDTGKLLYWLETTDPHGNAELFFGPLKPKSASKASKTSDFIKKLQAEMSRLEAGRLVYVAATRAKKRLHLFGHAAENANGEVKARASSLLNRLWPSLEGHWQAGLSTDIGPAIGTGPAMAGNRPGEAPGPVHTQTRIPAGHAVPHTLVNVLDAAPVPGAHEDIRFEWAGQTARAIGIATHRFLQHLAETGLPETVDLPGLDDAARRQLAMHGVPGDEMDEALARVGAAIKNALGDARGSWIFSDRHRDARCELPVMVREGRNIRRLVIDRTFIDAAGTRWIIDYKTSFHEGGKVETFLDEEMKRYRAQLRAYMSAFARLEDQRIRSALYYPLIEGGWRVLNRDRSGDGD